MCYGTVRLESSVSWRLPLAIQSFIALMLGLACFFYIPESPRWLAFKGRKDEASAIWDRLGVSAAEREKDALEVAPSITQSEAIQPLQSSSDRAANREAKKVRPITSIKTIFQNGGGKPMVLGTFMMCMQQLSGIDGVLYVSQLEALTFECPFSFSLVNFQLTFHAVCTTSIPTSWPYLYRGFLSGIWSLCHSNMCCNYTSLPTS